jgi:hypothetical protein
MRDLVSEDAKRLFRLAQIENEGNDPAKSGKSYGTPHDLATLYGRRAGTGEKGPDFGEVPAGYEDHPAPPVAGMHGEPGPEGGRPREHMSRYGTNSGIGGRDPLGKDAMKGGNPSDYENVAESTKKPVSANRLAASVLHANKQSFEDKQINLFEEQAIDDSNLLDESQIRD